MTNKDKEYEASRYSKETVEAMEEALTITEDKEEPKEALE